MDKTFGLEGKTFLIAGGTRGIGRAISLQFARSGARVVANYVRDEQAAQTLLAEAGRESLGLTVCRADLTSAKGLAKLDKEVETVLTDLSGLVFCAATGVHRSFESMTDRHFDWTFSLNVRGFFDLALLLLPRFRRVRLHRGPVFPGGTAGRAFVFSGRRLQGSAGIAGPAHGRGAGAPRHPGQHPLARRRPDRGLVRDARWGSQAGGRREKVSARED